VTGGGELLQMRFHFGERDRDGDGPLEAAVMAACARRGVEAAALLRGVEGFGAKHSLRTERLLSLSEDAPLVAVAVGETEVVEGLMDEVGAMATTGTATASAVEVAALVVASAERVKATVWGPRSGNGSPHLGAVAAFRRCGADAATVLLGVDGVLGGERRRARFLAGNQEVPAMTVAVGERARIETALAELGGDASLVTVEGVELSSRIAELSLHTPPAIRVTLVTSEIAKSGAHPRYLRFIHALREEGAAGATALRGVWGFRGGREPHGDRVLALHRDVPILVEAIDTPERASRWAEIASDLAGDDDLVYAEPVARSIPFG
jgi:PII-like signaling protein